MTERGLSEAVPGQDLPPTPPPPGRARCSLAEGVSTLTTWKLEQRAHSWATTKSSTRQHGVVATGLAAERAQPLSGGPTGNSPGPARPHGELDPALTRPGPTPGTTASPALHSPERLSSLAAIAAAAGLWREQRRCKGRAPGPAGPRFPLPRPPAHRRPQTRAARTT